MPTPLVRGRADVLALVIGAATAVLSDRVGARLGPIRRTALLAVALPVAAAVYPLARTDRRDRAPLARETAGLAVFGAVGLVGALRAETGGNRVAAAGWLAHAAFDVVHDPGRHSRIPDSYPAMCAGYDLTLAALLARR